MTDYTLISKALDGAQGAYEKFVLEGLMDRLRDDDGRMISPGHREFANSIIARHQRQP